MIFLKGKVHPKMKILSSFTHPQVVPNLYECLCSAEHKGRYSEECGKQSSSGAPLTSIVFFFLLWKSMMPQNNLVTNVLQNIFLCVRHLTESKWWQNFHFWVNYPFNVCDILQARRENSVTNQLSGKATAEFFCQDFFEMTANLFIIKATGFMHDLKPTINENNATKCCRYSYHIECFFLYWSKTTTCLFLCWNTKVKQFIKRCDLQTIRRKAIINPGLTIAEWLWSPCNTSVHIHHLETLTHFLYKAETYYWGSHSITTSHSPFI